MLDNDDLPIGRVLNRREVISLLGSASAAAFLAACTPPMLGGGPAGGANGGASAPATDAPAIEAANANLPTGCVVRPALTEGPLFVEEDLNRSDIRLDPSNGKISQGTQLDLTFRISSIANSICSPLADIQVDIWHCDADGIYSDTSQLGMNSVGQKFLRGFQKSDENGVVKFTTIYPGWYVGRTVHIHFKMRTSDGYDFTSQLFFDDALSDTVFAQAPYNSRGERSLRNSEDGIFGQSGGQLLLVPEKVDGGYTATFDVALDMG